MPNAVKEAELSVETSTTMINGAFRDAVSSLFKGAERASQLSQILQNSGNLNAEIQAVRSVAPMVAPSNRHASLGKLDESTAVGLERAIKIEATKNYEMKVAKTQQVGAKADITPNVPRAGRSR